MRRFFALHPAVNRAHHRGKAGQTTDKVGYRLRQKYPVYPQSAYVRQNKGEWYNDNRLAQQGEENCLPRFAQADKYHLTADLERHHKESKEKDLQTADAIVQYARLRQTLLETGIPEE